MGEHQRISWSGKNVFLAGGIRAAVRLPSFPREFPYKPAMMNRLNDKRSEEQRSEEQRSEEK